MQLNLITLATVKAQLGILTAVTTYDTSITAMIPIVSNDVRRILNTNYDNYYPATIVNGSADFSLSSNSLMTGQILYTRISKNTKHFMMGQVIYSDGLPDDIYIISYNPSSGYYTLSANATEDSDYLYPTINISQWPAISKMIFYKISKQTTDAATTAKYQSIRYGNVSKTFAPDALNKKYDYPAIFISELGTPFSKVR